jgi:2-iminobutanoate/2-iminopropanoate deaminase|uniref:RidA family protein n=1 Tax=Leptospirillum ferriphilum TaxID=178606 RepID=A0A7C3LT46_9BACT
MPLSALFWEARLKRDSVSGRIPLPVGPYSVFRESDGWFFISGQIGLDPLSGELVSGGVGEETSQILSNISNILRESGLEWDNCLKVTIYLADMGDFQVVNEIYGKAFSAPYPARSTVGVKALPKGARVEVEVIARKPGI